MLIALIDIAEKGQIGYSTVYNKVFFYGIPIITKLTFMGGKYKDRHCKKKYIEEKNSKYILKIYNKDDLKLLVMKWYERKTNDEGLLYAFRTEFKTLTKKDLMRFCIIKNLI